MASGLTTKKCYSMASWQNIHCRWEKHLIASADLQTREIIHTLSKWRGKDEQGRTNKGSW